MKRAPALLGLLFVLGVGRTAAAAEVCYRLPFTNPDLADGWGSTCCGRTNPHRGVDFPQAAGTPIPAVADGVIHRVPYSGCLGNVVIVEHADGMFSGYNHMIAASPLAEGTAVKMGQTVGQVGNTGSCSFGAHLHLTMAPTLGGYASEPPSIHTSTSRRTRPVIEDPRALSIRRRVRRSPGGRRIRTPPRRRSMSTSTSGGRRVIRRRTGSR